MVPIYQELAQSNPKLRILVFSGDDDTVCATIGNTKIPKNALAQLKSGISVFRHSELDLGYGHRRSIS